jgi:hypothetical protein
MSTAAKKPLAEPPNLTAALDLLAGGYWPVPIHPPTAGGASPGKRPIGNGWGSEHPTPEKLRETWKRFPDASVGLLLGPESAVSDFEEDGPEGPATWIELCGGECIETMGWSSYKGAHRLVAYDDRFSEFPSVIENDPRFPGLSLRLGGGKKQIQSVCPPSLQTIEQADGRVITGPPRQWNGCTEVVRLPDHVIEEIARRLKLPKPKLPNNLPPRPLNGPSINPSNKKAGLYAPPIIADGYGRKAMEDELKLVETAGQGGRNNQLNCSAFRLGQLIEAGKLDRQAVEDGLKQAANAAGLQSEESEKTIRSGIDAGIANPRDPIPDRYQGTTKTTKTTKVEDEGALVVNVVNVVSTHEQKDEPVTLRPWPAPPADAAWRGVMGELAQSVAEFTEADPIGILAQGLVAFGSMIGRAPCFYVGATRHGLNEFVCTTGPTGTGRKGTAKDVVTHVFSAVDSAWHDSCIKGGMSSGEGIIWEVRDPIHKQEPIKEKGKVAGYQLVMIDEGIGDKRLLAIETEFGGTLKILAREGNTLSAVIRQAWDNGMLRMMTKSNPARSTGAHISIIAHVTEQEVNKLLSSNDAANGFANRFLWVNVKQARRLPHGSKIEPSVYVKAINQIRAVRTMVPVDGDLEMTRSPEASERWASLYMNELARVRQGLLASILGRAEAHVLRLSCIYALMDGHTEIQASHIESAYAFWEYCERSAAYIFGDNLGDRDAETLLSAIRASSTGLDQTAIVHEVFSRNRNRREVARITGRLLESGLIYSESVPTGGRPATVWYAVRSNDINDINDKRDA